MDHEKLSKSLEQHGFFAIDLEEALANCSDVELLSAVEKLILMRDVSWDKGIPLYKKRECLNLLLEVLIAELRARFYVRIAPKDYNIAEAEIPRKKSK